MKTRLYTFLSIAVLPFALFSCMKEFNAELPAPEQLITITATIPGETKVVAVDAATGIDWNWQASDQVAVLSGDNVSVFDIRSGFGPKEASFLGKEISGTSFTILYPGTCTSLAAMEGISLQDQMQTGNDSKAHLKYFAALEGLSDYKKFSFSAESGTLRQCGVLRFQLTLPEETTVVNRVVLKAGAPVFHIGNAAEALSDELSVSIAEGELGADKTITAWMNTSWFNDVIPSETPLTITVNAGEFSWVYDMTPAVDKTIKSGFVNKITVSDASVWVTGGRYADGDGTEENPWQIKTPAQLTYMRDDMAAGEMRYFKLMADVDMAGQEWAPLNNAEPYNKFLYFDGNGHAIRNLTIKEGASYASFAGVLYGVIKNLTISGADITAGSGNKSGILAGYVGTADALTSSAIIDVTVKNSSITGARSMGAMVGQVAIDDALFANCHVINTTVTQTATSTCHAGGFVGYSQANASYVGCTTNATVNGTQYTGGFAGYMGKGEFVNCRASGVVSGTKDVGGFVGKSEIPTVLSCVYDGLRVVATDNTKNCHAGGFVGYAAKASSRGGVFTECKVDKGVIEATAGQRVGGFVGQTDLGNRFSKCAVLGVVINAGQNSGGFAGVDYSTVSADVPDGGIYCCYVEGGYLYANGNNCGGFVGYPEGATIENSYTSIEVNGAANAAVGGFIGICNKNVNVRYSYSSGAVNGTGSPIGAFIGKAAGDASTHVNACIAWNNSLAFAGAVAGEEDITGNYLGTEGTLAAKAAELGWDSSIWDFSAKLRE